MLELSHKLTDREAFRQSKNNLGKEQNQKKTGIYKRIQGI